MPTVSVARAEDRYRTVFKSLGLIEDGIRESLKGREHGVSTKEA